jgi:hypothetical protein
METATALARPAAASARDSERTTVGDAPVDRAQNRRGAMVDLKSSSTP